VDTAPAADPDPGAVAGRALVVGAWLPRFAAPHLAQVVSLAPLEVQVVVFSVHIVVHELFQWLESLSHQFAKQDGVFQPLPTL
jgi:hypothetical protein